MKDELVYANGHLKKHTFDTVACKYRGTGVECPKSEVRSGLCEFCGWNPKVEASRIARLKK